MRWTLYRAVGTVWGLIPDVWKVHPVPSPTPGAPTPRVPGPGNTVSLADLLRWLADLTDRFGGQPCVRIEHYDARVDLDLAAAADVRAYAGAMRIGPVTAARDQQLCQTITAAAGRLGGWQVTVRCTVTDPVGAGATLGMGRPGE